MLDLVLDRTGPTLTMRVHVFSTSTTTDERGYFKRERECVVVTLKFSRVDNIELAEFNHQNVLRDMQVVESESALRVTSQGVFGLSGSFRCDRIEIVTIQSRMPAQE